MPTHPDNSIIDMPKSSMGGFTGQGARCVSPARYFLGVYHTTFRPSSHDRLRLRRACSMMAYSTAVGMTVEELYDVDRRYGSMTW
jgi:hypothetical protein